ncbi:dTDP-4-dehydrorhamnose reductase [Pseudoalteromonas sp. S4498]|uniref:dTDP-4-dehydrorhamnose reductase n=1 Tax=Pseudoalteromonas galatheae TaxID=579562 RepID=UPI001109F1CB|nr:dTDP-4-dehydrorhamnose reductase [Pseudoalteromonas galatheae]NKC17446.1 dTDP-4-dehydrorhamnose reductase [Pseudoalteromonas galatheae]
MRILITGRQGQVGTCLTEKLSHEASFEVLALTKTELDITDQARVNEVVYDFSPNIIINAAAYTAVDKAEEQVQLAYGINRDGPSYLAKVSQQIGATLLHISTDYVFDGNKLEEYVETDATKPLGIYGQSKLAGELAVAEFCEKHIILRTSWVFGEYGNNFVKTMLRIGAVREQLNIVGDQFGGPTYAGDIADSLIEIAKKIEKDNEIPYGVYHFSGLPQLSWYEFADFIFEQASAQGVITSKPILGKISTEEYPTLAKRPANSRLKVDKLTESFSIEASNWKAAMSDLKKYIG